MPSDSDFLNFLSDPTRIRRFNIRPYPYPTYLASAPPLIPRCLLFSAVEICDEFVLKSQNSFSNYFLWGFSFAMELTSDYAKLNQFENDVDQKNMIRHDTS